MSSAWSIGARRAKADLTDPAMRARWHAMLAWIASERDYKPGWVAHKYKEKFGTWPPWGARPQPIAPTPEVRSLGALAHDRLRAEVGMKQAPQDQRPICAAHDRDAALAGHARA